MQLYKQNLMSSSGGASAGGGGSPQRRSSSSSRAPDILLLNESATPNHVYELPRSVTRELGLPAHIRLMRMGVHGEGSCAFHSMCAALNVEDYVHRTEREQKRIAYAFRCDFQNSFDRKTFQTLAGTVATGYTKSYEKVSEGLCDPHTWADEVTIKHAANKLKANILFIDIARNKFYCGVHNDKVLRAATRDESEQKNIPTIIVNWCNHTHFEPLGRILEMGPATTTIQLVFRPHDREEDAQIVNALMKTYAQECRT